MADVSAPGGGGRRGSDATFELNLAPFLDIIVSIIPMLLLSIAFVQVKMIEAPTPQVVSEKTQTPPKPEASVLLKISKNSGFVFEVTNEKGQMSSAKIALASGQLDWDGLLTAAMRIKDTHPQVTSLQLMPEETVPFDDLVKVMDTVRMRPRAKVVEKVSVTDAATAKPVENQYIFPDIVFASVGG